MVAKRLPLIVLCLAKIDLACYEEPGTRKTSCIDRGNVESNGDVRSSPLYSGGPNQVDKTPYFFISNCAKQISTLQDRQGVNFGGGLASATPSSAALTSYLCAAKSTKKNPKLQQFTPN
jgi:hypothetical protein